MTATNQQPPEPALREPRYTDTHRYPRGYTPGLATDIRTTFERVRAQIRRETGDDPLLEPERKPKQD